jgi:hypothetical protein
VYSLPPGAEVIADRLLGQDNGAYSACRLRNSLSLAASKEWYD